MFHVAVGVGVGVDVTLATEVSNTKLSHQGCMKTWRVSMCKDEVRCALDKFISHSRVKQTPPLRLET